MLLGATLQGQSVPKPAGGISPAGPRVRFLEMFARGYFPGRTGQLMIVPREGDVITRQDAAPLPFMHGSPWPYDVNIPMFFVGAQVRQGVFAATARQQDVAVTLAAVLGTSMPPSATGRVLPILRAGAAKPRLV